MIKMPLIGGEQPYLQLFHGVTASHFGNVGGIIGQASLPPILDESLHTPHTSETSGHG